MKMWKRLMSLALVSTLLMGLCACNRGSGDGGGGLLGGGNKKNPNGELAKQYVYRLTEFDLESVQEKGSDNWVQSLMASNGRVYLVMESYNYATENSDDAYVYRLLSMKEDGSDLKEVRLQASMEQPGEEVPSSEAQPDTEGDEAYDPYGPGRDVYENTNISQVQVTGNGFVGMKNYYFRDYSDPENSVYENKTYLCAWDKDGNMLRETEIEMLSDEDTWHYVAGYVAESDGSAILLIGGDDCGRLSVDAGGNVSDLEPVQGLDMYFENSASCAPMADGQLFLTYYGEDWTKMYGIVYNPRSNVTGAEIQFSDTLAYNMGSFEMDKNGDLIYGTGQGVFKYHPGDEEGTQLMSFINSDMYLNSLPYLLPIDDDHFIGMYNEYDEETYNSTVKGGLFTRVDPSEIPDKSVLVLGGEYIGGDIEKRVIEFNKSSDTHRIVIKDYSSYNSYEDYEAGYTQLNNDIISGNMPDILIVDGYNMPVENYIAKGLLADVGKLLEEDEELSQKEYMDNVFEAYKVDGTLYQVIPSFNVQTYIGKTSLVGGHEGWSMEEAQQVLSALPGEPKMFGDMIRSDFFYNMMRFCGSDFVDVSTGVCNFDSDSFIELLEFAKDLPQEMPEDYYEGDWYTTYESQFREDRTLLSSAYISSVQDMVYTINGSFGEDVSYVGFPTSGGDGSVINVSTSYALSASSPNLETAWEFVRFYYTDEYQDTLEWQLPITKKRFDELAEKATKKPTYEDGDGNIVEEDYTNWINGESIVIDPLTEEQLNKLKNFIGSVTKRAYYNDDISNIISEETEAFFQGQKSAKDVASIIQRRAQVYVDEHR
ncbi:MAG: extracellular solute-binding protein [Clostridium sp.]|nr:extracellular solute-binding protein [Acetatifactor muris]MCM1525973.1 extracellular solute-binding protein [Bacteroides sp.]MCM1562267.1 extracellular solute-binding protein [Clostridium sp.]